MVVHTSNLVNRRYDDKAAYRCLSILSTFIIAQSI